MPNRKPKTSRSPHLWLIAALGVIVPRRLRADWRQEWEAELRCREALLADWDKLDWRHKLDLLVRSVGAFWDALWLQPARMEDEMLQDLSYGARMLWKNPGFTATAVLTLALGIGASTAIFSAVNPILFEPLPYPNADRIAMIWDFGGDGKQVFVTFGTYRELAERSRSFDALAVMKPWQPTLTGTARPELIDGQRVSAGYFRVLGVSPTLGRDFQVEDDEIQGPNVVIISDALWRRGFGADSTIVGRQIAFDSKLYTVIGVMPRAFENVLSPSAEVWAPLQYDKSLLPDSREWGHHLRMAGRLRPDVGIDQAKRELDTITQNPVREFHRAPYASLERGLFVNSLQGDVVSGVRPALLAVLGAVMLLLAIASVNVTNLQLARGAQRRGELAIRAALGAPRIRLMRQLVTESLLLAALGGAFGIAVAAFGVPALVALCPPGLPRVNAIEMDGRVFVFAISVTTLIGLTVGLIPALDTSRRELQIELQQSSQRTTGGHQFARRALVVAEVALALVLLVSAGLLLRSVRRLFAIDPGFDPSHLVTMQVQVSGPAFKADDATHRFFARVLEKVLEIPGVTAAAFTSQLPLSGDLGDGYGVRFESSPTDSPWAENGAFRYAVSPDYFDAMGIPVRRGRLLDAHDKADSMPVVVISESLAKSKFPNQDPIGQRLRMGPNEGPWDTIVGVAGDVKQASLSTSESDAVYITNEQWHLFADHRRWLVVRSRDDVAAVVRAVEQAIWSVDKDQPIARIATMDERLAASAAERRFTLVLFEMFGVVALVLAAIGIYGVLSGSVTERTREIGVRLALGAQRRDVLGMILRQGASLTLVGVGLGLLAACAATRLLTTLLYGVSATDPLIFSAVALLLTAVALLACLVPARRATRVDPLVALRHE